MFIDNVINNPSIKWQKTAVFIDMIHINLYNEEMLLLRN